MHTKAFPAEFATILESALNLRRVSAPTSPCRLLFFHYHQNAKVPIIRGNGWASPLASCGEQRGAVVVIKQEMMAPRAVECARARQNAARVLSVNPRELRGKRFVGSQRCRA